MASSRSDVSSHKRAVKVAVDTSAPRAFGHLLFNRKEMLNREVRQARIERDNGMLLDRLAVIKHSHNGRLSYLNTAQTTPGSLNTVGRQQNMLRIAHENQAIAKRLGACTSAYNRHEFEGDYQVAQGHKKHIAKYRPAAASSGKAPEIPVVPSQE